jgi:hypothetical protein
VTEVKEEEVGGHTTRIGKAIREYKTLDEKPIGRELFVDMRIIEKGI